LKLWVSSFNIIEEEPSMVKLDEPIVIVGDLHGQFYDTVHMLEKAGDPSKINYLFLGDYVDWGIFGIEVILLLYSIKVRNSDIIDNES